MGSLRILIVRSPSASIPVRTTPELQGFDLCADLPHPVVLGPQQREVIPTGLSLGIPEGARALIRPRECLALQYGVTVANGPWWIAHGCNDEVRVALVNRGAQPYTVAPGSRIAQVLFSPGDNVLFVPVASLQGTPRHEERLGNLVPRGASEAAQTLAVGSTAAARQVG